LNGLAALYVGRRLRIPVIYDIRAFWEDAAVDHQSYREDSWKYRLSRNLETWVCRKTAHVAVLCNGLRRDLIIRGIPSEKLTMIPNGIDPEKFRTPASVSKSQLWNFNGKRAIGFIGSFYRYEGLDLLVNSFHHLVRQNGWASNFVLVLAGGGEVGEELRTQAHSLGIADLVIFAGRVPHASVPELYSSLEFLIYPRKSMRLTERVTPLKPLEAMAMGRPLIASDVGGHRELVINERTGLLFKAGDSLSLSEAMKRLGSDDQLRESLALAGRNWVLRERTWSATTAPYQGIYETLIGISRAATA
jgi:PEP-CTERM/exosortase A-associated glycosyltransferase